MIAYLVNQILMGKLTYKEIITARTDLKDKIDEYISNKGLDGAIDKTK